jgi:pimeloyl-ACP methyl ester carboxylesterase
MTGMPTLDLSHAWPTAFRVRTGRDVPLAPPLAPTLSFPILPRDRDLEGVVLLLHGGMAASHEPVRPGNLAAWRMTRFVPAFRTRTRTRSGRADGKPRVAVALLRDRVRGWNAEEADVVPDPVADALWALDEIGRRFGPVPVVPVGHSMGGRAALRVAGYSSVRAVAALAPWLPSGEPLAQLAGRDVLIAHGSGDRVTSPDASRAYARDAAAVAKSVELREFPGGHAMLRGAGGWHRLVCRFALDSLGGGGGA